MTIQNTEVKMPHTWSENGDETPFSDLAIGYFVKVRLHSPPCGATNETVFFGIYRGIEESECGPRLVLETEGQRLRENTVGLLCDSEMHKYYLDKVQLVEILVRDQHAVLCIFHALGVSKLHHRIAEEKIKKAQSCLS